MCTYAKEPDFEIENVVTALRTSKVESDQSPGVWG